MPTPVGHALGGLAAYLATRGDRKDWALLGASLASALLPDLDFLIRPFAGRSYHHYFTHSLGFAALFFGVAYVLLCRIQRAAPWRDAWVMTGAYLSHIILDLLAKDTSPPFGVQLLWPFSDAFFISPVAVFTDIWRGSLALLFGLHNWTAVGWEVLVLSPLVGLLWWLGRLRAQLE